MIYKKLTIFPLSLACCLQASAVLSFNFNYTGSVEFNDATHGAARQAALQSAADTLGSFFGNTATLDFQVGSIDDSSSDTLAYAYSAGASAYTNTRGYLADIAQNKALTGVDDNGTDSDGAVVINFANSWDLDDNIASGSYDFKSVVMHELLHTLGFASGIQENGDDYWSFTDYESSSLAPPGEIVGGLWTPFDDFIVTGDGTSVIDDNDATLDTFAWAFEKTGGDSQDGDGLFWNGANAVAANGGNLVGLYTPWPWEEGSSVSHLDTDNPALADSLMSHAIGTGAAARTLTAIEKGMLMDLGYTMAVPEPSSTLLLGLGLGSLALVVRRRK